MATWPAALPQNMFLGASDQDDESRVRSAMDAGPASIRNRFTAIPRAVKTNIILTGAQRVIFDTFFRTTLNHGTSSFDWKDPVSDGSATYRFRAKPAWTCVRPASDPDDRLWQATLDLELMP